MMKFSTMMKFTPKLAFTHRMEFILMMGLSPLVDFTLVTIK
jgi:hypothetical protein